MHSTEIVRLRFFQLKVCVRYARNPRHLACIDASNSVVTRQTISELWSIPQAGDRCRQEDLPADLRKRYTANNVLGVSLLQIHLESSKSRLRRPTPDEFAHIDSLGMSMDWSAPIVVSKSFSCFHSTEGRSMDTS